jgi:hypothetical protein
LRSIRTSDKPFSGIIVQSGGDACVVAEAIGGTEAAFAEWKPRAGKSVSRIAL